MVNDDPNRRTWSYEKEPNVFEYEEPKKLIYNFFKNKIFNKYNSKDVYVIGFSLGALVCYEFICTLKEPLGGIFPVSGFSREKIILNEKQKNTPIVIGHGLQDEVVISEKSIEAYELLKKQNANVKLLTYQGGHRMSNIIINAISNTINFSKNKEFISN
jgi:Predicted esterase